MLRSHLLSRLCIVQKCHTHLSIRHLFWDTIPALIQRPGGSSKFCGVLQGRARRRPSMLAEAAAQLALTTIYMARKPWTMTTTSCSCFWVVIARPCIMSGVLCLAESHMPIACTQNDQVLVHSIGAHALELAATWETEGLQCRAAVTIGLTLF